MAWYVVQYKPLEGDRAFVNLSQQGIESFFPKITVQRIRNLKRTWVEEPLFKGYLFINMQTQDPLWSKIRSTRGVSRIVIFGGRPAVLADTVMQEIQKTLDGINNQDGLQKGQELKLEGGPFSGINAIFQSYDGDERAVVLITFMQKQQRVKVPLSAVASA
ncbi:transcription termination/antitermination NusG family protein [Marinobacter sp. LV10MA510-1]|uniref:transcription termination/antitermination NusG family protein n=1 Tax=Marinobacter sp. LV10MA510-1 TaxID=1415567 RepID=UPI000BF9BABF|nr:transcription termination/antitermination NusG family protein [Marinobacter sp. LV10MA510-1]PFG07900.1 transcriptional antiterminator RfaH [Marinobacter sp. LV10MA510-1]